MNNITPQMRRIAADGQDIINKLEYLHMNDNKIQRWTYSLKPLVKNPTTGEDVARINYEALKKAKEDKERDNGCD